MKKTTSKTYLIKDNFKVLQSISYVLESGMKTYEVHFKMDEYGTKRKYSESKKINGKIQETTWYDKDSKLKSKDHYEYFSNGQLNRFHNTSSGAYRQFKQDQNGVSYFEETEDVQIYHSKIIDAKQAIYARIEIQYEKYSTDVDENITVKIFRGLSILRELEFDTIPCAFESLEQVAVYYEALKKTNEISTAQPIQYIDFSGQFLDIVQAKFHQETHYEYHENGQLKQKSEYSCSNRIIDGKPSSTTTLRFRQLYNTKGLITSIQLSDSNQIQFEYTYDTDGNWTESREISNGNLIRIRERQEETITKFPDSDPS
ncbi:MAG: hypothetical protein P1U56_05840 [Saprospiraceae bacterium]|nr:hypothetical protein [Saprospiraceae bacterium]